MMVTVASVRVGLAGTILLAATLPFPAISKAIDAKTDAKGGANIRMRYAISLIGLPIGVASVSGTLGPKAYRFEANGKLTGLAGVIIDSKGAATSTGTLVGGRAVPASFAATAANSDYVMTIRMSEAKGNATAFQITPAFEPLPDRVPLTSADTRNIIDPLSSFFMPVPGDGEVIGPAACNRTLSLFDGGVRFDIVLSFTGTRQVDSPAYHGPVAICSARYKPYAGHRPDRPSTKFMVDNKDMSVWLAPVGGTRYVVPYRVSVLSMVGTTVIEATSFEAGTDARTPAKAR